MSNKNPLRLGGDFFLFLNECYFAPILYIPVPQSGHLAFIAGLPFFIVTFSAFDTSFLALHFTQYIEVIRVFTSFRNRKSIDKRT